MRKSENLSNSTNALLAADRQAVDAKGGAGDGAAEFEVAGDFGNVQEHVFQVSGDGDFFDGIGQLAAGNPKAGGAAGVVPGDQVHPHAHEFGYVEAVFHLGDQLLRRSRAGLQKIIAGADAGSSREPAGGVAGGLQAEFFSGVGIENVRSENAVFDDHGAARGNALAVERTGAEAADDSAVVDDGDAGRGDGLAEFSGEERSAAIDGVSVHAFENVLEDGGCDHGVEDDGNMLGFHFARAQAAKRSLGGDLPDMLGRLETIQVAGDRVPVVALHGAFFILRDGDGGDGRS